MTNTIKLQGVESKAKNINDQVIFDCIGKKVTMTIQELVDHYIEDEISKVAKECNF